MFSFKEKVEDFLIVWKYHTLELVGKLMVAIIVTIVLITVSRLFCR